MANSISSRKPEVDHHFLGNHRFAFQSVQSPPNNANAKALVTYIPQVGGGEDAWRLYQAIRDLIRMNKNLRTVLDSYRKNEDDATVPPTHPTEGVQPIQDEWETYSANFEALSKDCESILLEEYGEIDDFLTYVVPYLQDPSSDVGSKLRQLKAFHESLDGGEKECSRISEAFKGHSEVVAEFMNRWSPVNKRGSRNTVRAVKVGIIKSARNVVRGVIRLLSRSSKNDLAQDKGEKGRQRLMIDSIFKLANSVGQLADAHSGAWIKIRYHVVTIENNVRLASLSERPSLFNRRIEIISREYTALRNTLEHYISALQDGASPNDRSAARETRTEDAIVEIPAHGAS